MTEQKSVSLETFTSIEGTKEGVKVYFSYTAPSVALAYQAATYLCDLLDKPITPNGKNGDHVCPIHGVEMTRHEKEGGVWYSHKLEDGSWCRGKAK